MHGFKRDGKGYRDAWIPPSRARGFLLVVPQFPEDEVNRSRGRGGPSTSSRSCSTT
jgi:hypothetical protein